MSAFPLGAPEKYQVLLGVGAEAIGAGCEVALDMLFAGEVFHAPVA
jgi:hypothetical protein